MFGYIRPMECELRVREQQEYRAHYCGLCKTIGRRYGPAARLALSYDCAFLAAFLTAVNDPAQFEKKRCLCHACRGKMPMACASGALDYAADANVLLAWYSAADHWKDERRLSGLLMKLLLGRARKKAAEQQPGLDKGISDSIQRLSGLEAARTACADEPSDAFGNIMRTVVAEAPGLTDVQRQAAGWMFYNLGRWVYLIDAWDDREKDTKRGAYNPFLVSEVEEDTAKFLLYMSIGEAEKGYDLLDFSSDHGLTDNILHLGCRAMTRQILNKEKTE